MEQTESHGTERKTIGLKHGNGIFEDGTNKKRNKKNSSTFLIEKQ